MTDRPTPETDAHQSDCLRSGGRSCEDGRNAYWLARRLERERNEAREWQAMLSGWGGTPEIVHEFIKGQQARIHAAQEAERERDEALEAAAKWKSLFGNMERDVADQAKRANNNREWALRTESMYDELVDQLTALENSMAVELAKLERERDEARDAAEKAKAYKRVLKDDNAKLRRDLDKAQKDADTFLKNFGKTQERAINAERELDELNKRLIEVSQLGVDLLIEREDLRNEIAAERTLADRLANSLMACERWVNQPCDVKTEANKSLIKWEETRK